MVSTSPAAPITPLAISSEALLRVARESLDELEQLLCSGDWLAPDSVHDLRVLSKRLRAWWRFWRQTGLQSASQQANQQLRQFSSQLSGVRDAQVLPQYARTLTRRWQDDAEFARVAPLLQCWIDSLDASLRVRSPDRVLMASLLDRQRRLLLGSPWPFELELAPVLVAGCDYIQGAAKQAFAQASSEAFHKWRKRVKTLYYQTEMLAVIGCNLTLEHQPALKQLAADLGDLHDLDNLLHRWLRVRPADMMASDQVWLSDALLRYQQRLRDHVANLYQSWLLCEVAY